MALKQKIKKAFKSASSVDSDDSDGAIKHSPAKSVKSSVSAKNLSITQKVTVAARHLQEDRASISTDDASSGEESSSEHSSSDDAGERDTSKDRPDGKAVDSDVSSGSENNTGSDGESNGDSDSETSDIDEGSGQNPSIGANSFQTDSIRPPKPFDPPPGFNYVSSQVIQSTHQTTIFDPTYLLTKNILHLSLPASLPVSSLSSLSTSILSKDKGYIEYNNTKYKFSASRNKGTAEDEPQIFLPTPNGYTPLNPPTFNSHITFERTLPSIPSTQTLDSASGKLAPAQIPSTSIVRPPRPPRPQPAGLRMRFKPTGSRGGPSSDEEDGSSGPPKPFHKPTALSPAALPSTPSSRKTKKSKDEKLAKRKAVGLPDAEPASPTKKRRADRDEKEERRKEKQERRRERDERQKGVNGSTPPPAEMNGVEYTSPEKTPARKVDMDALLARHMGSPQAMETEAASPSKKKEKKRAKKESDGAVGIGESEVKTKDHKKKRKRDKEVQA